MGRDTKLTIEIQENIIKAIQLGLTLERAVQLSNISLATYYNWKKWGSEQESGIYFDFLEAVKRSEAEAQANCLAKIQKAASDGAWQASSWILERRFPREWCRKDKIEHSGSITQKQDISLMKEQLSNDPEARKLITELFRRTTKV